MAEKITKNEAIINVLLEGGALNAKEVAEKASEDSDIVMSDTEATALLGKLVQTDLGYFIERRREGRRFIYEMIEEARVLTPEQARGLSLKRGKDRYVLEQAVEDYPDLGPVVQAKQEAEASERRENEANSDNATGERGFVDELRSTTERDSFARRMTSMEGKADILVDLLEAIQSGIKVEMTHDVRIRIKFE